jgi:flagellar M-ring protein FliF
VKLQDLIAGFQALSPQKKFIALFLLVSVLVGAGLLAFVGSRPDFEVLYSHIEQDEATEVIAKLKDMGIPYRLGMGGSFIEVPREKIHELRLTLAGEGIFRGGGIGFELFDKDSWNMSRFVQEVNYRRALEGELARTIMSVEEVEGARVHLVLPERSPFVGDAQSRPKASVVLTMRSSGRLSPNRVKGIVYLVSGSVEGLSPEDVSVIDTEGSLLTNANPSEDEIGSVSSHQMEYRRELEANLEQRVTRMLEKMVGPGNAIVRIAAELDFRKVEQQEELYDPDSVVVRSEQKRSEKVAAAVTGGTPGLAANQPGGGGAALAGGRPSEKKEQVLNYEINKVVKRMVESAGAIQRLSVAVLVHENEELTEEERERLSALVKGAVGFDEGRGDQIEVASAPFEKGDLPVDEEVPAVGPMDNLRGLLPYAFKYGGLAMLTLILIFTVLRPLLRNLSEQGTQIAELQRQLPDSLEKIESRIPDRTERDRLVEMVQQDPLKAAQVIRMWMREA